jgi:hypothetical protein
MGELRSVWSWEDTRLVGGLKVMKKPLLTCSNMPECGMPPTLALSPPSRVMG